MGGNTLVTKDISTYVAQAERARTDFNKAVERHDFALKRLETADQADARFENFYRVAVKRAEDERTFHFEELKRIQALVAASQLKRTPRLVFKTVAYDCGSIEDEGIPQVKVNLGQVSGIALNTDLAILQIGEFLSHGQFSHTVLRFLTWLRRGKNEPAIHELVDLWVEIVIVASGLDQCRLVKRRDSTDLSTSGTDRCDVIVELNGVAVIRIEEKRSASDSQLREAHGDLVRKMDEKWLRQHPKLPYVIGIAAAGQTWNLYKITKGQSNVCEPWMRLDLRSQQGREAAVAAAITCARVLKDFSNNNKVNPRTVPFETTQKRTNCSIYITLQRVEKRYTDENVQKKVLEVLRAIKDNGIDNTIRLIPNPTQAHLSRALVLEPVGWECDPKSMGHLDVAKAVVTVLHTLSQLHRIGWCHCDVRWRNIIFDPKNKKHILIDFEHARRIGDPVPKNLRRDVILPGTKKWDQAADTFQVVCMLLNCNLSPKICEVLRDAKTKRWDTSGLLHILQSHGDKIWVRGWVGGW